jgi:diguanylate cyclase (GGDEF)-like protein/PAS domain S-box-containing protein
MSRTRTHVDVLVVAEAQNLAERLNSMLRNAGHAVRLSWAADAAGAEERLREQRPDLLFCATGPGEIGELAALRDKLAVGVPIVALGRAIDESAIAGALAAGARDLVSIEHAARLEAVVVRELGVADQARRLAETEDAIRGYQTRFESLLTESNDAIAYVQDGIITSANPAFLERFGIADTDSIEGQPLMDLFGPESQGALKDALRATHKGKDAGALDLKGVHQDGPAFEAKTQLRQVEMEGEPCIEVAIRAEVDTSQYEEQMAEIARRDPLTGLYHRHYFVEVLTEEVGHDEPGASRALYYLKPDKFSVVEERVGLLASDQVLKQLAELLKQHLADSDLPARFGGNIFTAIVQRGSFRDVEALAERIREAVAKHVFSASSGSTPMTVSIGIADLSAAAGKDPSALIAMGQQAVDEARKAGGNRSKVWAPAEVDKAGQMTDAGWVKRITAALKEDKFQLAYQGIASLQGDATDMMDVLVRMVGDDGKEIMPGEFMPAAVRNGLMVGIDRWIAVHALRVAVERAKTRDGTKVFLRLSDQSLTDPQFGAFLAKTIADLRVPKGALVLQVAEKSAVKHLKETQALSAAAQQLGCGFALEHFGVGHEPLRLLDYLKPDFVKVDGSYMAVIGHDDSKRAFVKELISSVKAAGILTIAERVENANVMALLWQLGADFIQGNYVQEPEVIMADGAK